MTSFFARYKPIGWGKDPGRGLGITPWLMDPCLWKVWVAHKQSLPLCCRELVSCSEQQRWPTPGMSFSVYEFLVKQEDGIFIQNPVNIVILDEKINYFYSILVLLFWEEATLSLNNFFPLRDEEVRREGKLYGRTIFILFCQRQFRDCFLCFSTCNNKQLRCCTF